MTTATEGRRGRPRVQTLDDVIAQAIAQVDEHGLAGLTMSSLARRLGVATMTLYGYVPSREGLVDLMIARLLTELPAVPALDLTDWIDSLADHMVALRAWAVDRPALLHLNHERPSLKETLASHVQGDLDALTRLGFTAQDTITLRHTLTVHLNGQLEFEVLRRRAWAASVDATKLHGSLSEAASRLQTADMADVYAVGVRALLVGFAPLLDVTG